MASSTLFPPIVASVQGAFDKTASSVKIYFSLSSFNSISDVKQVHISVRYQSNNNNALSESLYPNTIKLTGVQTETSEIYKEKYGPYYIILQRSDLKNKGGNDFEKLLKIQLRLSSVVATNSASNLQQNLDNFSEWSTVTLIQGITIPTFQISNLEADQDENNNIVIPSGEAIFLGVVNLNGSKETIRYWRMKLYNSTKTELLSDSGVQLYDNSNYNQQLSDTIAFECKLPYFMADETEYVLEAYVETRGGYIAYPDGNVNLADPNNHDYLFTTLAYSETKLDANINVTPYPEEGYFEIKIETTTGTTTSTRALIRRASAKTNFTIWEDIAGRVFANEVPNWTFRDFTVQSGEYYRYAVQTIDNYLHRGQLQRYTDTVMMEYDHAFLYEKGQQLKLKYDFRIDSLATTVYEQKIDTIGDKYAHILRNGDVYYRTFTCAGLISQLADVNAHLFVTRDQILDNQTSRWMNYLDDQRPYHTYDYTSERNFRQFVETFLYDGEIKLFKSMQEGNILIKLDASTITLTPKTELGRLVYEFSATAYEVAECGISNYMDYGIIDDPSAAMGDISFSEERLGRINGYEGIIPGGYSIMNTIMSKYGVGKSKNGIMVDDFYLTHLRVEFDSEPYLIDVSGSTPRVLDDILEDDNVWEVPSNNMVLGHLLNIGGTIIVIPSPHNVYEMKADNVEILSSTLIAPVKDAIVNVDFIIHLIKSEDTSEIARTVTYYRVNGQIWDTFEAGRNCINDIFNKYFISKDTYYEHLSAVLSLNVEADWGTEFDVAYDNGETAHMIVGETGELFIDPIDRATAITEIRFVNKTDAILNYFIQTTRGVY